MIYIFIVVILLINICRADTVLGGTVDYDPKCYAQGSYMFFIEFNSVRPGESGLATFPLFIEEHRTLEGFYGELKDDTIMSKYFADYAGDGVLENTVIQAFKLRDKAQTMYLGLDLTRGIKMIRFAYVPNILEPGWMKGIQARFTNNFIGKISTAEHGVNNTLIYDDRYGLLSKTQVLGIDLQCFMAIGSIPSENRVGDEQLESCFYLRESKVMQNTWDNDRDSNGNGLPEGIDNNFWGRGLNTPASVLVCEQKSKTVGPPKDSGGDPIMDGIKYLLILGVGCIPVYGPVLAFGLGAAIALTEEDKFATYMFEKSSDYTAERAKEDFPKFMKYMSKIRK